MMIAADPRILREKDLEGNEFSIIESINIKVRELEEELSEHYIEMYQETLLKDSEAWKTKEEG